MCAAPQAERASSLRGIEALRAAAALAVVAYHAAEMLGTRLGGAPPRALQNGAAGVDVFFVVSGFVMVLSARPLAARPDGAWRFVRARLRRIVPLYWLCSAAKILALLAAPRLARSTLTLAYCASSFLFLPVHDDAGYFRPVLPVGWTLSFEMLFYALFAASLAVRSAPTLCVPPILVAIVLVPLPGAAAELGNPIILEFAAGTTLAALWLRGWRLPPALAWLLLALAPALLAGTPKYVLGSRAMSWGVPASALVAATVSLEATLAPRLPRIVLSLGAASYAIYLTHGFVLNAVSAGLVAAPPMLRNAAIVVPVALAGSAAFGWLVHILFEKPLLRSATGQSRKVPSVLVLAGGGLSPLSGGVGTLLRNLMEAWARTKAPPHIRLIDTRGSGGAIEALFHFAASLCLLAWLCATGRIDLVHAHMTTRGSAVRKVLLCGLAMAFRLPVIVHMHGADFIAFYRRLHPVMRWPLNAMLRRARHVVVLGATWREFLVQEAGVAPDRISIVPNGVPLPEPSAKPADAPPNLLFLGRLCARKGVQDLVAALASPALRATAWHATLAGDGHAAPYRAILNWHGLHDRVSLPGWTSRAETAALIARADILLLPSYHEAMPVAIIEALAAGIAVIATPVGAIPEILEDGESALLVQPGSQSQLTGAILRLLNDPALRAQIAASGHAVFRTHLDITDIAARIADLYRACVLPESMDPGPAVSARHRLQVPLAPNSDASFPA